MGIFPALIERRGSSSGPLNDFWYEAFNPATQSGIKVGEKTAVKYLTVFACVSLVAGDLARLPLLLYRKFPNGDKERVIDHPLYDLMHTTPNPETTSFAWREASQGHLMLWGNTYAMVTRTNLGGAVTKIEPVSDPGAVTIKRDPRSKQLVYKWRSAENNKTIIKRRDEMLHIPGFGFNGIVGLSMIGIAREAVGLGLAAENFQSRFFGEGTHPGAIIQFPEGVDLGDEQEAYLAELKKQYSGLNKSHSVMVLQNGEEYKAITMPLRDAQFIESRDHQKTEICGMYHVPPHKIALHGANSNYNNLEQENQSYVDSCLIHWVTRWEQSLAQQLLTAAERADGLFFEFPVDGLLRGDAKSRSEYYMRRFQTASLTPNEIRRLENQNSMGEDGDKLYVQLNMVPLEDAGDFDKQSGGGGSGGQQENNRRSLEFRSGIRIRDRISRRYYPLFKRAAEKIVNRESLAVTRQVKKALGERQSTDLEKWIRDFYNTFPDFIVREFGPVFRSFADAVLEATGDELGIEDLPDMDQFVNDYIDRYANRHTDSSLGQLTSLLKTEIEAVAERADEWTETRPDKIATNETTRGTNAIYQAIAFSIGLATYWRIRGPETCPYCRELNGRRVQQGEVFVGNGDEIKPEGGGSMKVYGMKSHPPLHRGCDCYLSSGA